MLECERLAHVGVAARGRKSSLWRAVPAPAEDAPDRQAELTRKIVRLIESALTRPERMQRHRDDGIGSGQDVRAGVAHELAERTGEHSAPFVFECVKYRAQRAVVQSNAAGDVERPILPTAADT